MFKSRLVECESNLFDLYLWPPNQGHNESEFPVDADLYFDVDEIDVGGVRCTVFLTRAEVHLSLSDLVIVMGSRLGDALKPITDERVVTEKITEKILRSGKVDGSIGAQSSGSLSGAISAAINASADHISERHGVVEHRKLFERVRPTTGKRWIINEQAVTDGGALIGKYLGATPLLSLSLYCKPHDIDFRVSRDASLAQKIRGNLINREKVAGVVKAKSLGPKSRDGLILLATAILERSAE